MVFFVENKPVKAKSIAPLFKGALNYDLFKFLNFFFFFIVQSCWIQMRKEW